MRWGPVLLCGWPGLARLWYRGSWMGLFVAIGFSVLLNTALVTSFVWPWFLGELFPFVAWPIIFLVWFLSAKSAYANLPDGMSVNTDTEKDEQKTDLSATLFNQAQREYLKGHWEETETLLNRRLSKRPRDAESRLLLATMLRRAMRLEEAWEQLDLMCRYDESSQWQFEIQRERELIELEKKYLESEEAGLDEYISEKPQAKAG